MITHKLVKLPFSPPTAYFVRTVEETEKTHWLFFKKKVRTYNDGPIGTKAQVDQYIKENNIVISDNVSW